MKETTGKMNVKEKWMWGKKKKYNLKREKTYLLFRDTECACGGDVVQDVEGFGGFSNTKFEIKKEKEN